MTTIIAHIDISRPSGRKIVREIEKKRAVTIEYPLPQDTTNSVNDWEEVYEKGLDMLSAHYDVDMRALKSKLK
jgi:hypothetical protein